MRHLALAVVVVACCQPAWPAEFHVAPSGSDAAPGTLGRPFATLGRARDALRELRAAGKLVGPATVTLRGGAYRIRQTLSLEAADSGTARAPVVWRARAGDQVRLLGGVPVTRWIPMSDAPTLDRLDPAARGKVLRPDLKALGISDFGEVGPAVGKRADLFCRGRTMTLARYPNAGWLRVATVPQEGDLKFAGDFRNSQPTTIGGKIAGKHYGRFCYEGDRPGRWPNATDLWVHGYWVWDYQDQFHAVDRLDTAKKEVWPKPPCHFYGYHENARYYFLNVLEELDRPGEWYLERQSGLIYFWPPEPGAERDAVFSVLGAPLIKMEGVSHLRLNGLALEAGRAGGIAITGGEHVMIAGCTLRNLAHPAIETKGGSHHTVRSCDLYELGGGGISLEGGERKPLTLQQTTTVRAAAFPPRGGAPSDLAEATFTGASLAEGLCLSDLPAEDVLAHPDMKRDTDYRGGKLDLGAKTYAKGLLLCPEETQGGGVGHATWLRGLCQARRFTATIGIEDMMKENNTGSVVFTVDVFRKGKWERLLESRVLRLGQTQDVDANIAGAEQLRLMTGDGGDNIYGDHAVWADARLR